jgi:four helix bundle protein
LSFAHGWRGATCSKYTEQIRDASDSAQRNVSEGFARFNPPDFVRFLDFARASATETQSLLLKGRRVGLLDESEFQRLSSLCERGLQALARLQRYLRSPQARKNANRRYKSNRRQNASNSPNASNAPNDPNDSNDPNA